LRFEASGNHAALDAVRLNTVDLVAKIEELLPNMEIDVTECSRVLLRESVRELGAGRR
jgi:hypothetical protein